MDGLATGTEGLEQLDIERRMHARTYAQKRNAQKNVADLRRAMLGKDTIIEERTNQRDQYQRLYEDSERKRKGAKVLNWILGGLALIGAGAAVAH